MSSQTEKIVNNLPDVVFYITESEITEYMKEHLDREESSEVLKEIKEEVWAILVSRQHEIFQLAIDEVDRRS